MASIYRNHGVAEPTRNRVISALGGYMANNRMFLIHKPSKLGVMLGKRMGYGWYMAPEKSELQRFFDYISENPEGNQDDFVLAMEDCSHSSCFGDWVYSKEKIDGFAVFEYTKSP